MIASKRRRTEGKRLSVATISMAAKISGIDEARGAQDADLAEIAAQRVCERAVRLRQELDRNETGRCLARQTPSRKRGLEFLGGPVRARLPLTDENPFVPRRDAAAQIDLNVAVGRAVGLKNAGVGGEPDFGADGSRWKAAAFMHCDRVLRAGVDAFRV